MFLTAPLSLVCRHVFCTGETPIIATEARDSYRGVPRMKPLLIVIKRWCVRSEREGEKASKIGTANRFYFILRHVRIEGHGSSGADFFFIDKAVIDVLNQFPERNVSLMALITWMRSRRDHVNYTQTGQLS
jgi:hypothetical protein